MAKKESHDLVIVESPAKAKTIEKYLGPGFTVLSSFGHVRDLPERDLSVDVDNGFEPKYIVPDDKKAKLAELRKQAGKAEVVWLATDEDREGEAISWHLKEALDLPESKVKRVTFNEITKKAVTEAMAAPRGIDLPLVDAQQARRVLDRLVGYELSPVLWRKVKPSLSAGRVQSVAVRLIVDREREVLGFEAGSAFRVTALFHTAGKAAVKADLPQRFATEQEAMAFLQGSIGAAFTVRSVEKKPARRTPAAPFTTSTLQQEASRKLGFGVDRTMRVAQGLYEQGHITYMRTDSVSLSDFATAAAADTITAQYGARYSKPRQYATKSKGAQEAHEAIRPTSFGRDPDSLASWLSSEELRLYRLIWQRAIASQMAEKRLEITTVDLEADRYGLRSSASKVLFDGFSRVYTEGRDDAPDEDEEASGGLPPLAEGQVTDVDDVTPTQHFTEPPPRYTEATLVKALEEHGIGRPSTYAATISTIIDRGYVTVKEKRLHPEQVARIVTDLLVGHFGEFVDVGFTARMEERLDEIANGNQSWVPVVRDFYGPFRDLVDVKRKELKRAEITTEPSDEVCSLGHPMVIRLGRNGRFLACSLYPEHKESRPLPGEEPETTVLPGEGEPCPVCGEGTLVQKRGRFGPFVGCSRYPECTYIHKDGPLPPEQLPFEVTCPTCKEGHLVARRARRTGNVFWGCSRYPRCRFTTSREPVGAVHDADGGPVARNTDGTALCLACGAPVSLPDHVEVGEALAGGPPDATALAPVGRRGGRAGGTRSTKGRAGGSRSGGSRTRRAAKPAA